MHGYGKRQVGSVRQRDLGRSAITRRWEIVVQVDAHAPGVAAAQLMHGGAAGGLRRGCGWKLWAHGCMRVGNGSCGSAP